MTAYADETRAFLDVLGQDASAKVLQAIWLDAAGATKALGKRE